MPAGSTASCCGMNQLRNYGNSLSRVLNVAGWLVHKATSHTNNHVSYSTPGPPEPSTTYDAWKVNLVFQPALCILILSIPSSVTSSFPRQEDRIGRVLVEEGPLLLFQRKLINARDAQSEATVLENTSVRREEVSFHNNDSRTHGIHAV